MKQKAKKNKSLNEMLKDSEVKKNALKKIVKGIDSSNKKKPL